MKVDLSKYVNRHSLGSKLKRFLWTIVWTCFARYTPRWCLNGWRCFLLRMFGAKIGKRCRIYGGASIWQPSNLDVGDNCWIDESTKIYCVDRIRIGNNSVVSAGAFLCGAGHDVTSPTFDLRAKPIVIGGCVWIASNSIVLPGVTIGDGVVVAAGAVVTSDVEPWVIVGGNPSRVLKIRVIKE